MPSLWIRFNQKEWGYTRHEKQNFRCLECSKQFSENKEAKLIDEHTRELVRKALLERGSLNGICRIFDVSMPWLLDFIDFIISNLPDDLNAEVSCREGDDIEIAKLEVDELWSFIGNKKNDQCLWLILHKKSRQVLAMQVGPWDKKTAELLFAKLPESLKKAVYFTDKFNAYYETIPWSQHQPVNKQSGQTSYIERFNCTLRQKYARLVRKTLSFSKKLSNHIGLIKYFICDYNKQLRALPV